MSREHESPEELKSLERQLVGFSPANLRIDRDRLMFLAGAASVAASGGRRPAARQLWPAATVALAATSLALLVAVFTRPAPQPQIVYIPAAPVPTSVLPVHLASEQPIAQVAVPPRDRPTFAIWAGVTDNYLRTRDVALRLGLDALGTSPADGSSSPAPSYRDCLLSLSPTLAPESGSQLDFLPRM